jgi:hypothetical protein
MTTVVQLRAGSLRRNNPASRKAADEFRGDVLAYGEILYDSLRKRRDFAVSGAGERASHRQKKAETVD